MKVVPIDVSQKQLSRLRNGHRVRVKKAMAGTGFNLLVDPSKFDMMSRSFSKGSAYQMQLSPDELMANKQAVMEGTVEGEGIFAGGRIKMPSAKKIGRTLQKAGKTTLKGIETAGKTTLKGIVEAEKAVRKNPVTRTLVKELVPLAIESGTEALATYAGADPATAKTLGKVGSKATKTGLTKAGYGLYAGAPRGRGLLGPPSRMPEGSSMSIGGTLLSRQSMLPPAMQSDPMGANFHMSTQMPVQFQRNRFT
jgi:hypothetical protein